MLKRNTTYLAIVLVFVCVFVFLFYAGDAEAKEEETVTVTAEQLNFRLGPGTRYYAMDALESGTSVEVLAKQDSWFLVSLSDGRTGWIHGYYTTGSSPETKLSLQGIAKVEITASSLNIRMGPGQEYTAFDQLQGGTEATILAEENGWLLVKTRYGSTGWVYSEYTRTLSQEVTVTASTLNVRRGPGTSYEVVEQFEQGTAVKVLQESNDWMRLFLDDGSTAWIYGYYTLDAGDSGSGRDDDASQAPSRGGRQYLQGRTIAIDPGHGGRDPGAVGVTGLQEKVVAMTTANKVAGYLRAQGAEVVLTRSGDYFVSLARRVNIAHNAGADIFVSIHANSHPNPGISGTETYYYNYGGNAYSSRKLARLVQNQMVSESGLRNIGVKHGSFYVIRAPWIPSVLVELGFLSNWNDENLLKQDWFLDGQAQAITRGIINYFN